MAPDGTGYGKVYCGTIQISSRVISMRREMARDGGAAGPKIVDTRSPLRVPHLRPRKQRWSQRLQALETCFVPIEPGARTAGGHGHTVNNPHWFLEERVGPIHVFEPVGAGGRTEQLSADLRH